MPIYEYMCHSCDKEFEELVFNDKDKVKCPACGSADTSKLMSCCRFRTEGASRGPVTAPRSSGRSACASCSGGNCSTCG